MAVQNTLSDLGDTRPIPERVADGCLSVADVLERYRAGVVTDAQLAACVEAGVMTRDELVAGLYPDPIADTRADAVRRVDAMGRSGESLSKLGASHDVEGYCVFCHKRVTRVADRDGEAGHHRLKRIERHGLTWAGCPFGLEWEGEV